MTFDKQNSESNSMNGKAHKALANNLLMASVLTGGIAISSASFAQTSTLLIPSAPQQNSYAQPAPYQQTSGTRSSATGYDAQSQQYNQQPQYVQQPQTGLQNPYLAGQNANSELPLVSPDYEQLLPAGAAPRAGANGAPQSYTLFSGSTASFNGATAPTAAPSALPAGTSSIQTGSNGAPKSTLLIQSLSGTDYSNLGAEYDRTIPGSAPKPAAPASNTTQQKPSAPKTVLEVVKPKDESSEQTASASTASTANSPSLKTSTPTLSLNAAPAATSQAPSLKLPQLPSANNTTATATSGDTASASKIPSLSLNSNSSTASAIPSLSSNSAALTDYSISGYGRTSTSVPAAARTVLREMAQSLLNNNSKTLTIQAYASERDGTPSAQVVSFARAIAVRQALTDEGVTQSRIKINANGSKGAGVNADRVEVKID